MTQTNRILLKLASDMDHMKKISNNARQYAKYNLDFDKYSKELLSLINS